MAIENTVSSDFLSTFVDSINVFDCHLTGVVNTTVLFMRKYELLWVSSSRVDHFRKQWVTH